MRQDLQGASFVRAGAGILLLGLMKSGGVPCPVDGWNGSDTPKPERQPAEEPHEAPICK